MRAGGYIVLALGFICLWGSALSQERAKSVLPEIRAISTQAPTPVEGSDTGLTSIMGVVAGVTKMAKMKPVALPNAFRLADYNATQLDRPSSNWTQRFYDIATNKVHHEVIDQMATQLLTSDVGKDVVVAVNKAVNALRYRSDKDNWGESDHWDGPRELAVRGGDCEDFAITKYMLLKRLGVNPKAMMMMVYYDKKVDQSHAVLAIHDGGNLRILDNRYDRPISARKAFANGMMIAAINERRYWFFSKSTLGIAKDHQLPALGRG
jgi:predicted transglutaminase-like cysteine proteinase